MKVLVEFAGADDATRALHRLTSLGYLRIETYSPFPITADAAYAPRGSFSIAVLGFFGGLAAMVVAYLIQWGANVDSYALNIGGRPAHAAPAFVPATFESICLVATLSVFAGFLLFERLPRLWQPLFEIDGFERASVDRFWLVLDVDRRAADGVSEDIVPLQPLRIIVAEGDV